LFFLSFFLSRYSISHSAHLRPMHIVIMLFPFGCSGLMVYHPWFLTTCLVTPTDYHAYPRRINRQLSPGHLLDPGCRNSVNNSNSGGFKNPTSPKLIYSTFALPHVGTFLACHCWRHSLLHFVQMPRRDGGHLFFASTCLSLRGFICRATIESTSFFIRWLDWIALNSILILCF
jgi:hypothetical protein